MDAQIKRRYRSPTRTAEAEIGLDEFDTDELHAELIHRGSTPGEMSSSDGLLISPADLNSIDTLLLCGQRDAALEIIGGLIFKQTGRRL